LHKKKDKHYASTLPSSIPDPDREPGLSPLLDDSAARGMSKWGLNTTGIRGKNHPLRLASSLPIKLECLQISSIHPPTCKNYNESE